MNTVYVVRDALNKILAGGSLRDCWKYLVEYYPDVTVKNLWDTGITIEKR